MTGKRKAQSSTSQGGDAGRGHGGGGMGGRLVMPVKKAKDFKGTLKRLLGYLKKRKIQIIGVSASGYSRTGQY